MLFSMAMLLAGVGGAPPPGLPHYPACAPMVDGPCVVPSPPINGPAAQALLAGGDRTWWVDGDILTVVARPTEDWVLLCCTLQTPLRPLPGTGLATISIRIPNLDEAIIDINFRPGPFAGNPPVYRGPRAPAAPERVARLAGRLTTHSIRSSNLGATRDFHVYRPPGREATRDLPVLYLADGGSPDFLRIAEAMIVAGRIRPIIIVGIDAARPDSAGEDLRSQEYIPDSDAGTPAAARYAAHGRFVADEVIPFVEAHYHVARAPAGRTVGGWSSGGMWSLAMAANRPDLFGNLITFSMAGLTRELGRRLARGKAFFGAGGFEGGRATAAQLAAEGAREGGADVRLRIIAGGHSPLLWEIYWAEALVWMFATAE